MLNIIVSQHDALDNALQIYCTPSFQYNLFEVTVYYLCPKHIETDNGC